MLAFPQLLGWLIGQPLDLEGSIAARLFGCAAIALGLGWWLARRSAEGRVFLHAGLLVYNFGAGAVFVLAALLGPAPLLPGLVGLLHLALGVAAAASGPRPGIAAGEPRR